MSARVALITLALATVVTSGGLKCSKHYYFDAASQTCQLCSRGPCPIDRYETTACNSTHDRVCSLLPTLASRDCVMGDYSGYLPCNASCSPGDVTAVGLRLRVRGVFINQRGDGEPCPSMLDYRSCQINCDDAVCDTARPELFGQNCSAELNPCAHVSCNTGQCDNDAECVCRPGFVGDQCQCDATGCAATAVVNCSASTGAVSCTECLPGFTGPGCSGRCNQTNCVGVVQCLQTDPNVRACAVCEAGWTGRGCLFRCPASSGCLAGSEVCDQAGTTLSCETCQPGFYGPKCEFTCLSNCSTSPVCDQDSGAVIACARCKPGFAGQTCDEAVPVCTRNSECPQPGLCLGQNCVCQFGFSGDNCATLLCDYDLDTDSCEETRCYPKPLSLPIGSLSACGPVTSCNSTHCCTPACAEARSVPILSLANVTEDTVILDALTGSDTSLKTVIGLPDALSSSVLGLPTSIAVVFRFLSAPTKATILFQANDLVLTLQTDRRTLVLKQGNATTTMVVSVGALDLNEWHVAAVAITGSGVFGTVNNPVAVSGAAPTIAPDLLDIDAILSAGTDNSSVEIYVPGSLVYLLANVDRPLHALDLLVLSGARIQAPTPAVFSGLATSEHHALSRLGLSRGFEVRVQATQADTQDTAAIVAKRSSSNTLLWYIYVSQVDRAIIFYYNVGSTVGGTLLLPAKFSLTNASTDLLDFSLRVRTDSTVTINWSDQSASFEMFKLPEDDPDGQLLLGYEGGSNLRFRGTMEVCTLRVF
eukprot:m.128011 g.128011  ORF g.128011 m.128011 type:complete len:761 (+) comp15814_c0_seq1:64-2346(+)